jgi:nitroreductase
MPAVDFFDVVTSTRAIRRYRDDPIPDEDLARMFFAATRAPSGSNSQPFRFVVLRDGPETQPARELLHSSFREAWGAKRRQDGYDRGSGAEPGSRKARMAAVMDHFAENAHRAPVIVLVCTTRARTRGVTDGASVYPACQNLLLAARALGYGGVLTMWHASVAEPLARAIDLPEDMRIVATIPLGRPEGRHGPVRRLPLAELVHEGRWGEPAPWAVDPPGTPVQRRRPAAPAGPR